MEDADRRLGLVLESGDSGSYITCDEGFFSLLNFSSSKSNNASYAEIQKQLYNRRNINDNDRDYNNNIPYHDYNY